MSLLLNRFLSPPFDLTSAAQPHLAEIRAEHAALAGAGVALAIIAGLCGWIVGKTFRNTHHKSASNDSEKNRRAAAEFVAQVSHDIRVPMNGVVGMTNLLLESGLSKQQTELAQMLLGSAAHVISLTDQLLDLAKIESGHLEIEEQQVELATFLEDVMGHHSARAAEKRLFLAYQIEAGVPEVVCFDPLRVRQVLGNLLSNGIKFTDSGEVILKVCCSSCGSRLRFSVRDTGIGVAREKQAQIFQAFRQADASIQRTHGGTGLGLTISRQLAELMSGAIEFESEYGRGSTFTLELPVKENLGETKTYWMEPQAAFRDKRVLLMESSGSGLVYHADWLEQWGFHVARTGTVDEALHWLSEGGHAEIALVDIDESSGLAELREQFLKRAPTGVWLPFSFKPPAAQKDRVLLKPLLPLALLENLLSATQVFTPHPPPSSLSVAAAPSLPESQQAARPQVLIADDDSINLRVLRTYLEKFGCDVTSASDGFEVLDHLRQRSYDVLFLDVMMPHKDGLQVLKEIRTEEKKQNRHRLPIIAVTARASINDREAGLAAGFDAYITKPLSAAHIREALQQLNFPIQDFARASHAAVASEQTEIVDFNRLSELASEDVAGMTQIAELYFQRINEVFSRLSQAVENKACDESYHAAHLLAGASATSGMMAAAEGFRRIESASKAGEFARAQAELAALRGTLVLTAKALTQKLPLQKSLLNL